MWPSVDGEEQVSSASGASTVQARSRGAAQRTCTHSEDGAFERADADSPGHDKGGDIHSQSHYHTQRKQKNKMSQTPNILETANSRDDRCSTNESRNFLKKNNSKLVFSSTSRRRVALAASAVAALPVGVALAGPPKINTCNTYTRALYGSHCDCVGVPSSSSE